MYHCIPSIKDNIMQLYSISCIAISSIDAAWRRIPFGWPFLPLSPLPIKIGDKLVKPLHKVLNRSLSGCGGSALLGMDPAHQSPGKSIFLFSDFTLLVALIHVSRGKPSRASPPLFLALNIRFWRLPLSEIFLRAFCFNFFFFAEEE